MRDEFESKVTQISRGRVDDEPRFDEVLVTLRDTEEWRYVEREVEIRVSR